MIRRSGYLLLLLLAILTSAGAWPAPAVAAAPRSFVAREATRRVVLTGFTRARARIKLTSEVSGRCLAVEAEVGQAIATDGVFARLDDVFVRLELEANRVEQARLASRVAYLEKEVKRSRSLVRRRSQAQSKLDRLEDQLHQARYRLKALAVAARTLEERRRRFALTAPAGWRVIQRLVEPGQWVPRGMVVGVVGDFHSLRVPLAVSPRQLQALRARAGRLHLRLPELDRRVPARLDRVSPAFDPATRKIKLELAIDGGLPEMRGGLRVELTLEMPDPSGAVLVPAAALSRRYQEYWLTRPDGSQVRVLLLGEGPNGNKRVAGAEVKPGQRFRLP